MSTRSSRQRSRQRRAARGALAAAVLAVASSAVMGAAALPAAAAEPDPMVIVAHRGDSASAPENTLAAIRKASAKNADSVEFDVNLTEDNVPVLMHDARLERTTNGTGVLEKRPYRYVRGLDAGSWFSAAYRGERVPTQYQAMKTSKSLGMTMQVELKGSNTVYETGRLVQRWRTLNAFSRAVAISFNETNLQRIEAADSRIRTGLITSKDVNLVQAARHDLVSVRKDKVTPAVVAALHAEGVAVYAWVANTQAEWNDMEAAGVDGIVTDRPGAAQNW